MDWPLLAPLEDAERRSFLAAARRRSFGRGEVVVHEGDPADSLHLVASGRLAVRVATPGGYHAMLNILAGGDHFGEVSLLADGASPQARTATVQALEPSTTLSVSARAYRDLCAHHRGVERLVQSMLARRVEELSTLLLEAMYAGLDRRVYLRLDYLVRRYADDETGPVVIPLKQELIAEMVGGTRPSVNQVLQRLVAQGIIELGRGRVTVLDRVALLRKLR